MNVVLWPKFLLKFCSALRLYWLRSTQILFFLNLFFMRDREGTKCFQTFSTSIRIENWVSLIKLQL